MWERGSGRLLPPLGRRSKAQAAPPQRPSRLPREASGSDRRAQRVRAWRGGAQVAGSPTLHAKALTENHPEPGCTDLMALPLFPWGSAAARGRYLRLPQAA